MASWSGEEVEEGLEKWLKIRRDELKNTDGTDSHESQAIDELLNELRDCGAEGWFPWQRMSDDD